MSHTPETQLRKSGTEEPKQLMASTDSPTKQAPPFQLKADPVQAQKGTAQMKTEGGDKVVQKKTKKGTVNKAAADGPYGWNYGYDWREGWFNYKITIKVKLNLDNDVTKGEAKALKLQTRDAFKSFWSNKFKLTDVNTGKSKPLVTDVVFVEDNPHLTVNVHKGAGRDDLSNWYTSSPGIVQAHELGHQLGLKDEYVDATVPERQDNAAAGTHTDNSLMGNFWAEGTDTAEVKDRHGDHLASDLSTATGKDFISTMR
jgi:hypothetical protein